MSLLLLGANKQPNVRSLFAQNEQGLAIDIGDRNGASEAKRTWRRNQARYSEAFTNTSFWAGSNAVIASSAVPSPESTVSAVFTLTEDSTNNQHYLNWNSSSLPVISGWVGGSTYVSSVYVKANGRSIVRFGNISSFHAFYNLTTGTVASVVGANTNAGIESKGNGWYRIWFVVFTPISSGVSYTLSLVESGTTVTYLGDGASGVLCTGYQHEVFEGNVTDSSTPTTYQPITDFNTEFKAAYPNHSLYVDSNGVAPAVYPGDQVGLVIDSSRGGLENLGSDLVSNGTFATDTVWSKGANWTIGSGVATKTGGAANNLTQTISSTAGLWYRITMDVTRTAGELTVSLGTSGTTRVINASGSYTFFILAGSSTQTLTLAGDSAFAGTVDNVTARLVPGNHAYQTNGSHRPALARTPDGGRRNLQNYSEQVNNWTTPIRVTVTQNATTDFEGNATADLAVVNSTNVNGGVLIPYNTAGTGNHTISVDFKYSNSRWAMLRIGTLPRAWFDIQNGVVGTMSGAGAVSRSITSLGNGWYRCSFTADPAGSTTWYVYPSTDADATDAGTLNNGSFVTRSQIETGSSATAYQRVGLTSDVTESGKRDCWGLLADGSDDSLITTSVDFNTWTQATRRNLLTDTESFGTATWTKLQSSVTENSTTAPDGTSTADSLIEDSSTNTHLTLQIASNVPTSTAFAVSVYIKPNGRNWIRLLENNGSGIAAYFDVQNGVTGTVLAGTPAITSVGNGWYRCSLRGTTGVAQTTINFHIRLANADGGESYTGNGTNGVYLWGAQIELGTLTDYQRVGTDKMTVMAGLRKLSDAASACFVELGTDAGSVNGTFAIYAPRVANAGVDYRGRGTTSVTITENLSSPSPTTLVFTGQTDIAGDSSIVRKNGSQINSSSSDLGSGNFANLALNLMRRSGGTIPFTGILYTLIIRGATTPTGTIADFEKNLLRIRAGLGPF